MWPFNIGWHTGVQTKQDATHCQRHLGLRMPEEPLCRATQLRNALKLAEEQTRHRETETLRDVYSKNVFPWVNKLIERSSHSVGSPTCAIERKSYNRADHRGHSFDLPMNASEAPSLPEKHLDFKLSTTRHQHVMGDATSKKTRISYRPILPALSPLPDSNAFVPIHRNLHVPDEEALTYVPYLGDGIDTQDEKRLFADYEVTQRQQRLAEGPPYRIQKKEELIDLTLDHCGIDSATPDDDKSYIVATLASLTDSSVELILRRWTTVVEKALNSGENGIRNGETRSGLQFDEHSHSTRVNFQSEEAYSKRMNTYRELYCAVCFRFDCSTHGNNPKPPPAQQLHTALRKEHSWEPMLMSSALNASTAVGHVASELNETQQEICVRLCTIFAADASKVADCIRAPANLVESFMIKNNFTLPELPRAEKSLSKDAGYYSVKNYRHVIKVLDTVESKQCFPLFDPCFHDGPCIKGQCKCIDNNQFCTMACCNGAECSNFFRGCCCKGSCSVRKQCTCLSMGRECDPSLCKCGTCSCPPNRPLGLHLSSHSAGGQRCRNDNLTMNRGIKLLLAKSTIAGWGCFTKFGVSKGDFIGEYVGEVISHDEAERRGSIADQQGKSYIFSVSCDADIDAKRKGNEIRFMNHSEQPNCRTNILFAHGIQRVGIWALCNIDPQSELTISYGKQFNNHVLVDANKRKRKRDHA